MREQQECYYCARGGCDSSGVHEGPYHRKCHNKHIADYQKYFDDMEKTASEVEKVCDRCDKYSGNLHDIGTILVMLLDECSHHDGIEAVLNVRQMKQILEFVPNHHKSRIYDFIKWMKWDHPDLFLVSLPGNGFTLWLP